MSLKENVKLSAAFGGGAAGGVILHQGIQLWAAHKPLTDLFYDAHTMGKAAFTAALATMVFTALRLRA